MIKTKNKTNSQKLICIIFLVFSFSFLVFNFVLAENTAISSPTKYGLEPAGASSLLKDKFGNTNISIIVSRTIQVIVGISASIMLVRIIQAGIMWIVSKGDSDKTKKSIEIITSSAVGILIIVTAYAIANFAINNIKYLIRT